MSEPDGTLAIIQQAIQNEIAGQSFYHEAAFHCVDPWAKEVFAALAEEEDQHTRLLLVEYESLRTQDRWLDPQEALERGAEVDITQFTFPAEPPVSAATLFPVEQSAGQVVDRRADDLDALAFGIELEKEAIDLYTRAGASARDPAAREAYDFLVEEETRHYDQLKAQWEKLAGRPFDDPPSGP